ncbi:MAG TPA: hypothetical protein VL625_01205 [Patescibacteria group bacterium]|jgi:hypothetical protein|nr:hypothetical protein [Patescibacteria group bacterium]
MKLPSENILSLQQKFAAAEYVNAAPDKTSDVKKILMVGATTGALNELSDADEAYLTGSLRDLKEKGVSVASDFQVSIANIDPAFGGEDFLAGNFSADLVVLCLVYDPNRSEQRDAAGFYATSPRHFENNAWHDAVAATGAKFVSVVGDDGEINAGHIGIRGGKFRLLRESFPETVFISEDYLAESGFDSRVASQPALRY